jgi:hypothetical protein
MLYRSLDRIAAEADILTTPDLPRTPGLSRRERLERWAESLGREPGRRLRALHGIEYGTPYERLTCRADGSPLAVAYADPVLRAAGLEGDTVGDAAEFFDLSHEQLNDLLCFCHHGGTVSASTASAQVRAFARQGDVSACRVAGLGLGAAAVAVLALVGTLL